ncbi:hypothetical protein MBLNU459_g5044t1 [Dothideomycetes sp. NU459]
MSRDGRMLHSLKTALDRWTPSQHHQHQHHQQHQQHQHQQHEARHLLRALLREATYLPDPHARRYVAAHVRRRFRDYSPAVKPPPVLAQRRDARLKDARKALAELRRANAGELKPLTKVLHLAYARVGKRRRQLVDLLVPGPHTAQPASALPPALPQLSDQLRAMLLSQMRAAPPPVTRTNPRSLNPRFPELNTWKRPMPQKRLANMTREWYASMLRRLVAPLPADEWDRLRRLALGVDRFDGPVPRRVRPEAATSISLLEKELGIAPRLSPTAVSSNPPELKHGHTLTPSFMRRRWASVFAQCPVMSWDSEAGRWKVVWGSDVLSAALRMKASPLAGHENASAGLATAPAK